MSARSSGRVGFGPNPQVKAKMEFEKPNSVKRFDNRRKSLDGSCRFRLPKGCGLSPKRYIKHLGDKIASVIHFVCIRSSPTNGSSSGRAKPLVAPVDSHRAKAIDECIDFINSSSSLQRSNSGSC
ncbi:hypothetical protein LguiA_011997 [Lonicera macranthoides]